MNGSRKLALTGLSLSLLFAFSVHYFATLLFVPFAIAELIRTISRRKLDIPAWVALAVPFSILALYLPIMHETHRNAGTRNSLSVQPAWFSSWAIFVGDFIRPALIAVICVALLYLVHAYFVQSNEPRPEYIVHPEYLRSYTALVLALACILPFAGIAVGKFVTQQFFPRYVIGSMFGVTGAATLIMWFAFRQSRTAAIAVTLVFGALFSRTVVRDLMESAGLRDNP